MGVFHVKSSNASICILRLVLTTGGRFGNNVVTVCKFEHVYLDILYGPILNIVNTPAMNLDPLDQNTVVVPCTGPDSSC